MESMLPLAVIVGAKGAARIAHSALPDAPVVPDVPRHHRVRAARPRAALARGLERLAAVVAPASPTCTTS